MTTQNPEGISPRIAAVAESATLAIDAKAKALKAAGEPIIGFGAGEPDFAPPAYVMEAAAAAAMEPASWKYTATNGLPELRKAIAAKTLRDSGWEVSDGQVLVTNGGKQACLEAFETVLGDGDECIVPAPYWTSYTEMIKLAGATPVIVLADDTAGFRVTVEQLESARTTKTKAIILNSPSNPTGAVYTKDQLVAIGEWAARNSLWVITDEIYEHLTYGDAKFHSLPVVCPAIADKTIVVNGVAKTYAMTGARVGWIIANPAVIKAATNLQSHATSNVNNIAQKAALAAVAGSLDVVDEMKVAYDRRRKTIVRMLNEIPGVTCIEPEGAFYAFANFTGVLNRDYAGTMVTSTLELAAAALDQAKIAIVPGEAFGAPGYIRFSYALADADLEEGITRLHKLIANGN
jgi:aspartate/methionine/tyrosine aminotransferase